jgi:hypothetical protein
MAWVMATRTRLSEYVFLQLFIEIVTKMVV